MKKNLAQEHALHRTASNMESDIVSQNSLPPEVCSCASTVSRLRGFLPGRTYTDVQVLPRQASFHDTHCMAASMPQDMGPVISLN